MQVGAEKVPGSAPPQQDSPVGGMGDAESSRRQELLGRHGVRISRAAPGQGVRPRPRQPPSVQQPLRRGPSLAGRTAGRMMPRPPPPLAQAQAIAEHGPG